VTLRHDNGASPEGIKTAVEQVHQTIKGSTVAVQPGQGHVTTDTGPQLFLDAVLRFLNEGENIMGTVAKDRLISAGEGKAFPVGESRITIKVHLDDTGEKYEVVESTLPPGFESPPHVHQRMEQAFYVLDGEVEFKLNEETVRARAGDLVRVPTGVSHAFSNPANVWGKVLQIHTGGGLEKMFEELAQAFPPGTSIDRERMGAIMQRYDQLPVAPHATPTR
jgi:quercetin dioxygenase-like cupin family protein